MQLFTRLEADRFARGDGYLGAGSRIASDARLARTDIEDPKPPQLDPFAAGQSFLQALEDGVHSSLGLHARQTGTLDDVMDNVLLNQCFHPKDESFLRVTPMLV